MEKVKLMIDSGSDISKEVADELDIEVVPLYRMVDGSPIEDYHNFDIKEYSEFLKNCKEIPTTSQPSPEAFMERFERFGPEYDHILCITMSVHGSGTFNSASIARDMYEEKHPGECKIHVFDSWSCSLNEVIEIRLAHKMLSEGASMDDVIAKLTEVRQKVCTYYLIDNIEFLIKGGRVSTLKGSIASKLKLKPIVTIKNGEGSTPANALGYQNGLAKMAAYYIGDCDENGELYISHVACPEKAEDLVAKIKETYPNLKYFIYPMLGTMSTQSGPNSIGMFYIKNK